MLDSVTATVVAIAVGLSLEVCNVDFVADLSCPVPYEPRRDPAGVTHRRGEGGEGDANEAARTTT